MVEKVTAEKAAVAAATAAAEKKSQKEASRGPEMHPDLLELYTVTDHVLGVGTFATVKEIKLKSTGKSYALKIILKKTLVGKINLFCLFFWGSISDKQRDNVNMM